MDLHLAATPYTSLVEKVRRKWVSQGIPIKPAASGAQIEEFERLHGVRFPDDLRHYFAQLYGMDDLEMDEDNFSFIPLHEVKPIPAELALYGGMPDYREIVNTLEDPQDWFVIINFLITSAVYAILLRQRADENPVIRIYDGTSVDVVASSFSDFLAVYLSDPSRLW